MVCRRGKGEIILKITDRGGQGRRAIGLTPREQFRGLGRNEAQAFVKELSLKQLGGLISDFISKTETPNAVKVFRFAGKEKQVELLNNLGVMDLSLLIKALFDNASMEVLSGTQIEAEKISSVLELIGKHGDVMKTREIEQALRQYWEY